MTLLCITSEMPGERSCVHRGQHIGRCDGFEWQWVEKRQREEATGKACKGCLPKVAQHGLLCWNCWDSVQTAITDWHPFEKMLVGVSRAVQRDNGGVRGQSVGYVPLPGTMLAIDEIRSYLKTFTGTMDAWVSTSEGAKDAVRFARAVPTAMRTHAVEEKPHKLRRLRCPDCGTLNFVWNPPSQPQSDITVTCECGKAIHEHERTLKGEEKLAIIANIESPPSKVAVTVRATGGRDEFAAQYDPTRPDHADLDPLSILTKAQLRTRLDPDHEMPEVQRMKKTELLDALRAIA